MTVDLFKDGFSKYKPEDWENDPLETSVSPERAANVRLLTYYFMLDSGITTKPSNMPDDVWNAYQEWLKSGPESVVSG